MFTKKKQALDFREIRRMLWRRRWLIVIPLLVTMAIASYQALTMPATYASTTSMAPETPISLPRQIQEIAGGGGGGNNNNSRGRRDNGSAAIKTRIMSTRFLEAVAVQIGLHENPALVAKAKQQALEFPGHDVDELVMRQCVARLRKMIRIGGGAGGVLNVTAVSTSPRLAQVIASTVTEQYLQTTQALKASNTEEALEFARVQMEDYEKKLEAKRSELNEYEQRIALKGLSTSPVSKANLTRVNAMVQTASADRDFQRDRHEAVRQRIVDAGLEAYLGLGVITSQKLGALRETLYELERNLALSMVEQPEGAASVNSAQTQIAVKSQQLLTELESLAESSLPSLDPASRQLLVDYEFTQVSMQAAAARRAEFQRFVDRYASDLRGLPAEELRRERLQEEVRSAERLYQMWLEQVNATQIRKNVESSEVTARLVILEPAFLPMTPFAPNRQRILTVALVMGIALGLGAAVLTEYFDLTLKSVEEIEGILGVPILGAVPRMQSSVVVALETRRRHRMWLFAGSSVLILLAAAAAGYWYFYS